MTYDISVLNMIRTVYLETWGLGIVDMNHISCTKKTIIMCLGIIMEQREGNMIRIYIRL